MALLRQTHDDAAQLLLGTVVEVSGGPHGDWTLYYKDGRVVTIDCGYVGATIWAEAPVPSRCEHAEQTNDGRAARRCVLDAGHEQPHQLGAWALIR